MTTDHRMNRRTPQEKRIPCTVCLKVLSPNASEPELKEFVRCTQCDAVYHKAHWDLTDAICQSVNADGIRCENIVATNVKVRVPPALPIEQIEPIIFEGVRTQPDPETDDELEADDASEDDDVVAQTPPQQSTVIPVIKFILATILLSGIAVISRAFATYSALNQASLNRTVSDYTTWGQTIWQIFESRNWAFLAELASSFWVNPLTITMAAILITAYIYFPQLLPDADGYRSRARRWIRIFGVVYLLCGYYLLWTHNWDLSKVLSWDLIPEPLRTGEFVSRSLRDLYLSGAATIRTAVSSECTEWWCLGHPFTRALVVSVLLTLFAALIYRFFLPNPQEPVNLPSEFVKGLNIAWYYFITFAALCLAFLLPGLYAPEWMPLPLTEHLPLAIAIAASVIATAAIFYWPPIHKSRYVGRVQWLRLLVLVIVIILPIIYVNQKHNLGGYIPIELADSVVVLLQTLAPTSIISVLLVLPLQRAFS